jgi:hypothetical protein
MKTLFARLVKAWLVSIIVVPCIVIFSVGWRGMMSVTHWALYLPPPHLLSVCLGGLRLPGCPAGIAVATPTDLSGVSHIRIFLDSMS